jgi:hypothetical protein
MVRELQRLQRSIAIQGHTTFPTHEDYNVPQDEDLDLAGKQSESVTKV